MTEIRAHHLAEAVAADGFDPHREALAALVAAAGRRGVSSVLLAVVADPGEPTVARERALGRIVGEYVSGRGVVMPVAGPDLPLVGSLAAC
jgi:hypothetical protein